MGEFNHGAIARLRPGVTEERALAELNAVQDRIVMRAKEKVGLESRSLPFGSRSSVPRAKVC